MKAKKLKAVIKFYLEGCSNKWDKITDYNYKFQHTYNSFKTAKEPFGLFNTTEGEIDIVFTGVNYQIRI
jgi:hypothetical protein